jgi:WD40 repeat protein
VGSVPADAPLRVALSKVASLGEGYGRRLAFDTKGRTWASADLGIAYIWRDYEVAHAIDIPGYVDGTIRYADDDRTLLAGPWIVNPANGRARVLPKQRAALVAGIPDEHSPRPHLFTVANSAWTPSGDQMVALTRFTPPRGLDDGYRYHGPWAQLLLLGRATGKLTRVLEPDCGVFRDWALACDDRFVAAGGTELKVWNLKTGSLIATPVGSDELLNDLQLSADGAHLAGVRADGTVDVWETADWSRQATWRGHAGGAQAAAFHPALPLLATGGDDAELRVWSIGSAVPQLAGSVSVGDRIEGLAFEPAGRRLLVAARFARQEIAVFEVGIAAA